MANIEGHEMCDAVHMTDRHEAGIMDMFANHAQGIHHRAPRGIDRWCFFQ